MEAGMPRNLIGTGRLAGLLYLIVVLTGIFCLAYLPSQVVVDNDPRATLANVLERASLFRWGIAAFLVMQAAFLLLPLALYRGFSDVNRTAATLMVLFVAVSVPIALLALSYRLHALDVLTDPDMLQVSSSEQRDAMAYAALKAYRHGIYIAQMFWGLWLLPLGWLIVKSRRLPSVLGVLLMLGCVGYLVSVFADLLVPGYGDSSLAGYVRLPASIGEIGTCLWLLLFGLRFAQGERMPRPA